MCCHTIFRFLVLDIYVKHIDRDRTLYWTGKIPSKVLLLLTYYLPIHSVELFAVPPQHKHFSLPLKTAILMLLYYTHKVILGGK